MWHGSARQACVVEFAYRPECMKHAAKCLARLIDVLLGAGAASLKKLEWGASLCILGIEFEFAEHGFRCRPSKTKAQKWLRCVRGYLASGKMTAGEASKTASRLSWAGAHMFRKLGRAMLRPVLTRRPAVMRSWMGSCDVPCCGGPMPWHWTPRLLRQRPRHSS